MIISEEIGSKYRFIVLAGLRVAQLQRGAQPRVKSTGKKHTRIAMEEIMQEKLNFERTDDMTED